jgi:hypothetical protein
MQVSTFASTIKLKSGSFNTSHIVAYTTLPICTTSIKYKAFTICSLKQRAVYCLTTNINDLYIERERCINVSHASVKKARFFSTSFKECKRLD